MKRKQKLELSITLSSTMGLTTSLLLYARNSVAPVFIRWSLIALSTIFFFIYLFLL